MEKARKIAFVCPRYRAGSAGGAESLVRGWAEHLAGRGHTCRVLTTRARNNITWDNELPGGEEDLDGVAVTRFDLEYSPPPRGCPQPVQRLLETPSSPALQEFLLARSGEFEFFIFAPYLFGLTGNGIAAVPDKSILVPCLHDEPGAYLAGVRRMFSRARAVWFNSRPEKSLAEKILGFSPRGGEVIGLGVESPEKLDPEGFRRKFGIERPFILYAGRREPGKGTNLLLEYFRTLLRHRDPGIDLILLGSGAVELGEGEEGRIHDLGYVGEQDKWNAYSAASIFCQPSTNESFSIVLLEAWLAGAPALVSAFCPVTLDHCRKAGGGLYFADYPEFEEAVTCLLENPETARALAAGGKSYVEKNYRWATVLDKLESALAEAGEENQG